MFGLAVAAEALRQPRNLQNCQPEVLGCRNGPSAVTEAFAIAWKDMEWRQQERLYLIAECSVHTPRIWGVHISVVVGWHQPPAYYFFRWVATVGPPARPTSCRRVGQRGSHASAPSTFLSHCLVYAFGKQATNRTCANGDQPSTQWRWWRMSENCLTVDSPLLTLRRRVAASVCH